MAAETLPRRFDLGLRAPIRGRSRFIRAAADKGLIVEKYKHTPARKCSKVVI